MSTIFRVDGSAAMGLGHIIRCSALAEGLEEAGEKSIFVTQGYDKAVLNFIRQKGFIVETLSPSLTLKEDLRETLKCVEKHEAGSLVTDSYAVDGEYLQDARKSGVFLITIDDKAEMVFPSDLVINQNLGFREGEYRKGKETRLLLGPRFAILRKEFRDKHLEERGFPLRPSNILVTLGGGDAGNVTQKVTQALLRMKEDFKIKVAVGALFQERVKLRNLALSEDNRLEVKENLGAVEMVELMSECDFAVSAGGTTCWELACLGLPSFVLILAENQRKNAEGLDRLGIAINLGPAERLKEESLQKEMGKILIHSERRKEMSTKGKQLVDGLGVERIVSEIYTLKR